MITNKIFYQSLKTKGEKILNSPITFDRLLADCAYEIRNGFLAVYPQGLIINCNFHVQKSIQKKSKSEIKNEEVRANVMSDIKVLQLAQSEEVFKKAADLLISKWERKVPRFTKYFYDNFILKRSNWYEGFSGLSPSTNNGQESSHAKIKLIFTNKKRVSMQEMKVLCGKIVNSWSKDLSFEKPFVTKVEIKEDEEIKAYLWSKNLKIEVLADGNSDR